MNQKLFFLALAVGIFLAGCSTSPPSASAELHGDALKTAMFGEFCAVTDKDTNVSLLGFLEEKDEVSGTWYNFIVCKSANLNTGGFEVKIRSRIVTGTSMTNESASTFAAAAQKDGQAVFTRGDPFVPTGVNDNRRIEYRFHQAGGKVTSGEVYVVLRDADRSAKEPLTLSFDWPSS